MPVTNWFIIFSLTMPATWIASLLSIVAVGLTLLLQHNKKVASQFIDASISFILVWKFSVILTDFETVLDQPLSILYFNGGYIGVILGTIAALYTLFSFTKREKNSTFPIYQLPSYFISFYLFFMVLLNTNTANVELFILACTVITLVLTWSSKGNYSSWKLLSAYSILFFSSFFQPLGVLQTYTVWLLSVLVMVYSWRYIRTKKVETIT
ncbi:hypothetical protein MKY84_10925 [Chryseomicrobium sp. FSL W7-1435]|uniref:hypothetical protein n=1 Tax=Chryseomicrobium sp. FSL W7-1435 TaxID=2921704 RepID=UPI00315A2BBD